MANVIIPEELRNHVGWHAQEMQSGTQHVFYSHTIPFKLKLPITAGLGEEQIAPYVEEYSSYCISVIIDESDTIEVAQHITYFHLALGDATRAKYLLWERQINAGHQMTPFSESCVGLDASIWTTNPNGEFAFRSILKELNIKFEEGDEQQVVTGWE